MIELEMIKRDVEVELHDLSRLKGRLFVSPTSPSHDGCESVSELFNGPRRFLPLELEQGQVILLQKEAVVTVLLAESEQGAIPQSASRLPAALHLASGKVVNGIVRQDLPREYPRLSDYLNQSPRFFTVEVDGKDCLVNASQVCFVEAESRFSE